MKLRDIAAAAGVSLSSVSLVLNGKPGVGPEKRALVQRMLEENGYTIRPFNQAEPLPQNVYFFKYTRHSFLVNGNPGFVTRIMDAVELACRKHRYNLSVLSFNDVETIDLQALGSNPATRGVILLGTELTDQDLAPFLGMECPLVVVDNAFSRFSVSSVTMNNQEAVYSVVEHLAKLGHKQIGLLLNSIPSSNDLERRRAFEEALGREGIPWEPELIFPIFPTMDGARQSVNKLLDSGVRFPHALVASNDSVAIGTMLALKEHGLSIPEDISITGIDGLPFSAVSEPPLTTVNISCEEMGRWAVYILHEAIKRRCVMPCKIRVGTRLELRGSDAAPDYTRQHASLLSPPEIL